MAQEIEELKEVEEELKSSYDENRLKKEKETFKSITILKIMAQELYEN